MYSELARNLRAEQRPIVDKTTGHFMAMTTEQKAEFVKAICSIYRDPDAMKFNPKKGNDHV